MGNRATVGAGGIRDVTALGDVLASAPVGGPAAGVMVLVQSLGAARIDVPPSGGWSASWQSTQASGPSLARLAQSGIAVQQGVNQLVGYLADAGAAVLPFAAEIAYYPQYLWPR